MCANEAEHERTAFFHGYGDLGMIMSVVARNADPALVLGEKGLRVRISLVYFSIIIQLVTLIL